jgi:hypothetical protein
MISSVEFLTRGGGKQLRADNRLASKVIIPNKGQERIALNQKLAR